MKSPRPSPVAASLYGAMCQNKLGDCFTEQVKQSLLPCLSFNKIVLSRSEAQLCRRLDGMDTVAALDTLYKVRASGVGGGIDKVDARLVDRDRISGCEYTDIGNAGVLCHRTGVEQFEFMKKYITRLSYLSAGQSVELYQK